MKLYLVRHGEAVSPEIDPNQPLAKETFKKLESFAIVLKNCRLEIAKIFHSSKLRAKQTAEILAKTCAPNIPLQEKPGLKPNDPIDSILEEIDSENHNLMIIGHLPFFQSLLCYLLKTENAQLFRFQAGSIVCLEKETFGWILSWALFPELVTAV